jgi:hypothetical protein
MFQPLQQQQPQYQPIQPEPQAEDEGEALDVPTFIRRKLK